MANKPFTFFKKGNQYFIRTVTHHYIGRLVHFVGKADDAKVIYLDKCSWVADDGRFHEAMKNGTFSEVEPYPEKVVVAINMGAVIDCLVMSDVKLPSEVK
jgi:hypothetical protein